MEKVEGTCVKAIQAKKANLISTNRVGAVVSKPSRKELQPKQADKNGKVIADLITEGYEIGDFLIVDTGTDRFVGFFVGLKKDPTLRLTLSPIWRNFNKPQAGEAFDALLHVQCREVLNIKAAPK